ncbi:ribbon-helix-helix protein, CopG family [Chloroflexota bacterium]
MVKGRNTTVISLRLPDDVVRLLKVKANDEGLSLSELLKKDELFQPQINTEDEVQEGLNLIKLAKANAVEGKVKNRQGKIIPESDWKYFRKHPDKNCPCGSKTAYRLCHGRQNM